MKRAIWLVTAIELVLGAPTESARAQAPIESELVLITPVSKFIHDAALKAFADYAKEKWNVVVKTNAIPARGRRSPTDESSSGRASPTPTSSGAASLRCSRS